MADLVATAISELSDSQLAKVNAIYQEAFTPDLRVPFWQLTTPGGADQTYVAMENLEPVGVAALRLLCSVGWSFLRYFAIAEDRRSRAVGPPVLAACRAVAARCALARARCLRGREPRRLGTD